MKDAVRQTIAALSPRVTQAQAIEAFDRGIWNRMRGARLRSVAAAYVPFRLFEVDVLNGGRISTSILAADAVSGSLDLYEFERVPAEGELARVVPSHAPLPRLDEARSRVLIEEKVRRAVFQAGFFRVRGLEVSVRRLPCDLHVPYWLGFYGGGDRVRLRAMDAVRRRMEGAKARALFEDWLLGRFDAGAEAVA